MLLQRTSFWSLILLAVCLVWGIEFSLVHQALNEMGPHSFNALRFLIAAITLQLYCILKQYRWWLELSWADGLRGLILGLLLFAGFATQSIGLQYTSASVAGFITGLNTVFVPILAMLLFRQAMPWYVWLAVAIATLGTSLLTGINFRSDFSSGQFQGELWMLGCAIAFAAHIIYTGVFLKQLPPLALAQLQLITVMLLSFIAAFTFEPAAVQQVYQSLWLNSSLIAWLALLIGGILATAFAYVAQTMAQQHLAAWRVALIFASEPLFAALGGYLILDERLTQLAWIGAACIILAIVLVDQLTGADPQT